MSDTKDVVLKSYGSAEFSSDVISRFPTLRADLDFDSDLLHPQMGTLAAALRDALSNGDKELALAICDFLQEALDNPHAISEIENAIAISFVEAYEFRASAVGREVLAEMSNGVRGVLLDQEARGGAQ
jgi:hypothetical protein